MTFESLSVDEASNFKRRLTWVHKLAACKHHGIYMHVVQFLFLLLKYFLKVGSVHLTQSKYCVLGFCPRYGHPDSMFLSLY